MLSCLGRPFGLLRALALLAMLAGLLSPFETARAAAGEGDALRVGSKRFTESYILAEILTQTVAASGAAQHRAGLGNTAIVFEALKAGSIDLYPDYTGTVAAEILKLPPDATLERMNEALAPLGLAAGVPLGFENTYALAVRDDAGALATLSDLAGQPRLRLGLSHEFLGRADGWPMLARRYGLVQQPRGLDHGIAYEALANRQVDAIDIYSTDAKIRKYRLRVLRDDRHVFPRYDAIVLYRRDVPARFPQAWQAISALQGRIDADAMIAMNARAELDGESFPAIARGFLAGSGSAGGNGAADRRGGLWATVLGPDTWRLTRQHVGLVAGAVGAATLVGVPLGIVAARRRRLGQLVLAVAGVLQTVPSLAMLAILIPVLGQIGLWPALAALFLYALLPIVRNTCTGLQQVPVGLLDAGRALGFSGAQNLRHVALPLAMPVMLAGIKTAAIISVGTATIAAFVGAGGYGERIATGLALNDHTLLLAGAIPSALLALVVQGVFEAMEWRLARRERLALAKGGMFSPLPPAGAGRG